MNLLSTGPEFAKAKEKYKDIIDSNRPKIDKTVDLFSRIKNTEQAEEVATVFYAVSKLKEENSTSTIPEREVYDFVFDWKNPGTMKIKESDSFSYSQSIHARLDQS